MFHRSRSREDVIAAVGASFSTRDHRDVLFWSEYPEEATIDTPEKRREIRELFKTLGMEVPGDLED